LDEAGDDPSLRIPLISPYAVETGIIGAEVLYAVRHGLAVTLADVLLRRTMVAYGPKVALDVDRAAAKVAQTHLGWSGERAGREVKEFREYSRRYNPRDLRGIQPQEL
jgi:glycerol-3-phosphate dehydrogenase